MQLSHKAITSFQKLYKKKCGKWLNENEAEAKALEQLKIFSLIYKPVPMSDKKFFKSLHLK